MRGQVNFRDAEKILIKNGFTLERIRGSHHYYTKGNQTAVINLKLNKMVWRRVKKENGIEE